jgi:ABC-2 type transport system ATP-binding protein
LVDGLVKRYPRTTVNAVNGLGFRVNTNEIFGLLGPNGAGKTTTVMVATTRARATAGTVSIRGIDTIAHPSLARRHLGVVTQVNTLDRSLSVWENLYYHCRFFGISRRDARRRSSQLLEQMGLTERAAEPVDRLSGGLAQRVQLARALAHRPSVLFLDEPTAGLDPQSRLALWDVVRDLREHHGVSVLLTTHYMEEAERLCDRLAIIDQGRILVCDTPEALKRQVGGQVKIELRLTGPPAPDLVERLRGLSGVDRLVPGKDSVEVLTTERDGLLPRLTSEVGPLLRDLSIAEPTLESVFISLTGRRLRD